MNLPTITKPCQLAPQWHFHNPVRVHFGRNCRRRAAAELAATRCLIVTTQRGRRQLSDDPWLGPLAANPDHLWVDGISENPDVFYLQGEIDRLAGQSFDAVLAFGGGSPLDAAKALALALAEQCSGCQLRDLLADPTLYRQARPQPLYAIPTTAGTGSEVTPYATIWDHQAKQKHSLAGPAVFPHAAFVDPALTDTLPAAITLSTGLDAINQAAESIWNQNANPVSLDYAIRALQLGLPALPPLAAATVGGGENNRDNLAQCSLLAGLAISHTRTALCHSISYPLTAHFGVPHGLACAFTMPAVLRFSLQAEDGRFSETARALLGHRATPADLEQLFTALHTQLQVGAKIKAQIPSLQALLALQKEMITPDRAGNILAPLEPTTLERILTESWQ
ncbi:phosphonoacetaldehyde reductase [Desulfurivibrio dismutans]|uniref:phosphonoacetaldehyde reductase n=1 Tax=Desulfurivibrio dismutans TaxID=1398908 RepID=UPI0023DA0D9E|nr:phosphonoacetaldehyde reductase [Desulfurivibrio alkaliphilus]MDF1615657.1 phosphonoacetaldehyde reductase [Desulfurivibrio alkaliphilus]